MGLFMLNYLGRKTNLIIGQTLIVITQVLAGIFFEFKMTAPFFSMILLFMSFWSLTQGSVIYTYLAEVTNDKSMGLCAAAI